MEEVKLVTCSKGRSEISDMQGRN